MESQVGQSRTCGIDDELQTHYNNPNFLFFLLIRKAADYKQSGNIYDQCVMVSVITGLIVKLTPGVSIRFLIVVFEFNITVPELITTSVLVAGMVPQLQFAGFSH
jgi:hypothetical protein